MIASTWYCIAQTSTFDTSCSINVTFDGYDIQFSASVKLGISAINITRCTIPDGIIFSIRLRESGSQWFIDLNSNTNISPVVTIADNEYWSIVNKPASEGNIILQLYDITSKYNTSTGGDSLFEIINVGSVDTPRYAVVPKIFQGQNPGVISRTFMTFGGLGTNSGDEEDSQGGVSYLRNLLDVGLADFLEDEDVLTYDKHSNLWVNKKGGFNEEKLQEYLDKHKYITEEYVKDLMELLKWFEFDEINNAVRVKSDFNFIVPNALSFGGLGTDSGDGEAGASYLKNLLDVQLGTILNDGEALVYDKHLGCWVNKAIETGLDLNALQKYLTDNDYITSASLSGLEDQVVQNKADITLLLSWLEYDKVNNAIRVKNGHNFIVDGTLSFGGAGNDDEATQEGLTQVTIQLGDNPNNSYTTENGVIKLPSYPVVPTKVSSFENDAKYITKAELDGIENEFAEIKEDLNALNDLLNDDVAGVINTWDEVVDFLNEYSESQDLASILSQMNADIANRVLYEDFEKLEDSVADIAGCFTNGSANNALKLGGQLPSHYATQSALNAAITNITAIGERVTTLEDLGLVRVREGSTYYIKSIYSIVSEGELISGRRASGSSSDVTGGGGISQVTAQMIVDALGYVPYSSQNPSGYITSAALDGYAKTSDIPSLSGYATQAWVEAKKYLIAIPSEYITETELSNTLGSYQTKITSSNKLAYSLISGTPSSLPASDVYAWAKKSSLAAADVPNLDWSKITSGKPTTLAGYGITDAVTLNTEQTITALKRFEADSASVLYVNNTAKTTTSKYVAIRLMYGGSAISGIASYAETGSLYRVNADFSNVYRLLDTGNYSEFALPLSGGTISSGAFSPLTIKGDNSYAGIGFQKTGDSKPSYLVYINEWDWRITNTNWADSKKILHSGNYSSYALPLSGGTISGTSTTPLVVDTTSTGGSGVIIRQNAANKALFGYTNSIGIRLYNYASNSYLSVKDDGTPTYNGYTLIHYGNIAEQKVERAKYIETLAANGASWYGDSYRIYGQWASETVLDWKVDGYEVRVDKAKKLNTARTIWGQSFDGSGNVSGGLADVTSILFNTANGIGIYRGSVYSSALTATDIAINGGKIVLNPTGNVLIGTTTDYGYKLYVSGPTRIAGELNVGNSSQGVFLLRRSSANYIWASEAGGYLVFGCQDSGSTGVSNSSLVLTSSAVYSGIQATLGLSAYRWGTLYGTSADFSGNITATGEVISTRRASSSDARLKDNINRLLAEDCLAMVRNLQPSSWDWKENGEHSMGFIAQDVEPLMPYAVTKIKDDVLGQRLNLQYDQFFAPVVGAIQCLDSEVEQLKKRVKYLENKLQEYGYNRY